MCQTLPGGATPPRCFLDDPQLRADLLKKAEEFAAKASLTELEREHWAEFAFFLRHGVWPDEAEERLAIQQEPRMLPERMIDLLRRKEGNHHGQDQKQTRI